MVTQPISPSRVLYLVAVFAVFYYTSDSIPAGSATTVTEHEETLVRRLIEKVTINEDKFTVEFKSGVTVDVDE